MRPRGIFHVVGPESIDRHTFAVAAADVLGLDVSMLSAAPTRDLGQVASRPLAAGLDASKLKATVGWYAQSARQQGAV
jgi:dTDP-4-dehydrorhamnose reductase